MKHLGCPGVSLNPLRFRWRYYHWITRAKRGLEEAIEAAAFLANNYDAIVAPKIDFHEFNFGVSFSSRGKKSTNRIAQSYSLCAFIDCVRYAFLARGKIVVSDKAIEAGTSKILVGTRNCL